MNMVKDRGCIASVALDGFGNRSTRFTKFIEREVILESGELGVIQCVLERHGAAEFEPVQAPSGWGAKNGRHN
jgi:hypothetical protein